MPEFFHIDNSRVLSAGQVIERKPRPPVAASFLAEGLDRTYPDGFGNFGWWYLFGAGVEELVMTEKKARALGVPEADIDATLARSTNRLIETVWELTRLAWFPQRASRLTTIFGYREL